jgi:hypothetical protein
MDVIENYPHATILQRIPEIVLFIFFDFTAVGNITTSQIPRVADGTTIVFIADCFDGGEFHHEISWVTMLLRYNQKA